MRGRVTCTYHCSACNGHFYSEGAFVLHRSGEGCIEPIDDGCFVALADDAKCELMRVAYTPLEAGNRQVYPAGWEPAIRRCSEWSSRSPSGRSRRVSKGRVCAWYADMPTHGRLTPCGN